MTDLTGKKIANTYKDLLQINAATDNGGIDGTLRRVADGGGGSSSLELSQTAAKINGTLTVDGNVSIANNLYVGGFNVGEIGTTQLSATNIEATNIVATSINGTNITVDGDRVITSALASVAQSVLRAEVISLIAGLSSTLQSEINLVSAVAGQNTIQTSINAVQIGNAQTSIAANASAIAVNTAAITSVNSRIQSVSVLAETKASVATSANLETRIASVSAEVSAVKALVTATNASAIAANTSAISVNESAITSVNTRINTVSALAETKASASTSANLETRINSVSALAETKASAATSATLETRIAGVSSTLASTSATLESHINTVSATLSIANVSIAANSSAIAALQALTYASAETSATLETRINSVSVLAETKASAATSATLETRIASVSATMATSVDTRVLKSGDTMTGTLTLNADPTADLHAATKSYVDNLTAAGIHYHESVRLEQEGNLTATYDNGTAGVGATLTNAGTQAILVVDSVTVANDDRLLIYEQTDATQNGVYVVTTVGSPSTNWVLTRSTDTDSTGNNDSTTLDQGSYFFVEEGSDGAGESYVCNVETSIAFGTTDITFVQFSSQIQYTAGTGINISPSRVISTSGVPTSLTDLGISDGTAGQFLQTDGNSGFTFTSVAGGGSGISNITAGTNIALTQNGVTVTDTTTSATINVVGVASAGTSATLESRIATVSSAMATSINNSNSAITALSATLESRIAGVSSTFAATSATLATSIANRTAAITSVNTRINSVSVLAETKASAGTSATLETRINNVSAAIPTNNNQLTNGAGYVTTDTNTTYTADGNYGMALSGTAFRLENDRRRNSTSEDVYSGNTHDYTFYDASVGIRWYTAGAEEMRLENDGDLHVDGNIVAYSTTVSDKRLKKNILSIDNALWRVKQLNGCTFTYLKDDRESAGLIAQDLEKVLPSAVIEDEAVFHGKDGETYKTVQYDQVIGLLVEAIKELTAKVEELENGSSD